MHNLKIGDLVRQFGDEAIMLFKFGRNPGDFYQVCLELALVVRFARSTVFPPGREREVVILYRGELYYCSVRHLVRVDV